MDPKSIINTLEVFFLLSKFYELKMTRIGQFCKWAELTLFELKSAYVGPDPSMLKKVS